MAGKVDTENLQHLESVVTATAVSEGVPGMPARGIWAAPFPPLCSLPAEGGCQQRVLSAWVLGGNVGILRGGFFQ